MAAPSELNVARKNLSEVLGNSMKIYLQLLKSWFKQKLSREEFDSESRKLLPTDSVHLHNQFLLAVLTKCQSLGSSFGSKDVSCSSHSKALIRRKLRKRSHANRATFHQRFAPVDCLYQVPEVVSKLPEEEGMINFCSRDLVLPDVGMLHGRMVVSAWDIGLEEVEDSAALVLSLAVEQQIKNVISTVLERRSSYKLRDGKFRYGVGIDIPSPYQANSHFMEEDFQNSDATFVTSKGVQAPSLKPSFDTGQRDAAILLASSQYEQPPKQSINLLDLFESLSAHKTAISSHTVYVLNMERVANRLFHPSTEEFEQAHIHAQEIKLKKDFKSRNPPGRTS